MVQTFGSDRRGADGVHLHHQCADVVVLWLFALVGLLDRGDRLGRC
jgi:hypothetical protein